MTFLPKNYETPKSSSNYMRFEDGDNRFRVLGSAIVGYQWWKEENGKRKPVRVKTKEEIISGVDSVKHFWAFPVYNFQAEEIQVLEITQMTIMRAIEVYIQNPKWGAPMEYDIIVGRKGEKMNTEYTVSVDPKEQMGEAIMAVYEGMNINLEALFTGDDPFAEVK